MKHDSQAAFEREMRRITLQTAECRLEAAKVELERERLALEALGDAASKEIGVEMVRLLRTRVRWLMRQESETEDC